MEFARDPFSTHDKYDFETVQTYFLKPGDDLETVISQHAKIALDPEVEYVIEHPVKIRSLCYIIGNGAKIKIACPEHFGIEIYPRDHSPGIVGMWLVTFNNVVFERERSIPGGIIQSRTFFLCHGCNFLGALGTAVSALAGGEVRGCHFFGCFKCVDSRSKFKVKVSHSVIETCMVGISASGPVSVKHCQGLSVYCFLFMLGAGKVEGNSVINPNKFYESALTEMVSCYGKIVLPLATVHISASPKHQYPHFEANVLTRCKVFVGARQGTFTPMLSSLSYTSIVADRDAFKSLNLNYTFHQTTTIWKLLSAADADFDHGTARKCLCGDLHPCPVLKQLDYTSRVRPNPYDHSCDSRVFSDDEN